MKEQTESKSLYETLNHLAVQWRPCKTKGNHTRHHEFVQEGRHMYLRGKRKKQHDCITYFYDLLAELLS